VDQTLFELIGRFGVALVFANVLLEQLGLPVPAIPTLLIAGALAADGRLPGGALVMAAVLACLLADCLWYAAGRLYGNRVMRLLCRISLTPDSCVSQTQERFERWGVNALVAAKFVPGLALIAPPLAGATRMGVVRFVGWSTLGSVLWVIAGLGLGVLLRPQIEALLPHLARLGRIALYAVLALLAAYVAFKWWERRRFYALLRMARISVAELAKLMDGGAAPLIVDVRSATARALEPRSIPGAVHVTLQDVAVRIQQMPRDRDIVLYCTCPNEASAASVAKVLIDHGFTRVRPLSGGLDAWIAAGGVLAGAGEPSVPEVGA